MSKRSKAFKYVDEFHEAFFLPRADKPNADTVEAADTLLRIDLINEEAGEFEDAALAGNIVGVADALADLVYVTYGAAITYGIDLDAVLKEVHRSNMTKLGPDGAPIYRSDGKVLKPSTFSPPDVAAVLQKQLDRS